MENIKFTFSGQSGTKGHCSAAQIWDEDGNSLAVIESTEDENDATDVARLFHASPDLLEALKDITLSGVELPINKCTKALRAIEKATK